MRMLLTGLLLMAAMAHLTAQLPSLADNRYYWEQKGREHGRIVFQCHRPVHLPSVAAGPVSPFSAGILLLTTRRFSPAGGLHLTLVQNSSYAKGFRQAYRREERRTAFRELGNYAWQFGVYALFSAGANR